MSFEQIARLDSIVRHFDATADDMLESVARRLARVRETEHENNRAKELPKLNPLMAGNCHFDNRSI